jgi:hypothetical protein
MGWFKKKVSPKGGLPITQKESLLLREIKALIEEETSSSSHRYRTSTLIKLQAIVARFQNARRLDKLAENARLEALETRTYMVVARLEELIKEARESNLFDYREATRLLKCISEGQKPSDLTISRILVRFGYNPTSLKVNSVEEARRIISKE